MTNSRRDFLRTASALLPGLALFDTFGSAAEKASFPGMVVRSWEPRNLEFPFATLDHPIVPNEHFFVRSHFSVPKVNPETWKLTVEGSVRQKQMFSLEELQKLPSKTLPLTLECAGNGRVFLQPATSGLQWGFGAVGNAEWTGVALSTVLEKAGLNPAATEVVLEGMDKGVIASGSPGPIFFDRGIPLKKALASEVILAWKMNGKDLPPEHGFPVRAVIGGWYGMASVKWLQRIVVLEKPYQGFWQSLDYSFWERSNGLPALVPLTEMQVKSSIARPSANEIVPAEGDYRISGAAWTGEGVIRLVEVSFDNGKVWTPAKLLSEPKPYQWVLWELLWSGPRVKGPTKILSRATDSKGRTQPLERDPDRRTYMINHLIPTDITVR